MKREGKIYIKNFLNSITIPFVILTLLILVSVVYISYQNSDNFIEQQLTEEYINIIDGKRDMFTNMANRIISLINNALDNESTLDLISGKLTGYDRQKSMEDVRNLLLYDKGFVDEYDFFYYGLNGIYFYKPDIIFKDISSFKETKWFKEASGSETPLNWFGLSKSEIVDGGYEFIVSLKVDIYDNFRGNLQGIAFFSIDDSVLDSIMKSGKGKVYIINNRGEIIYDIEKKLQNSNASVLGLDYELDIPAKSKYRVKKIDKRYTQDKSKNLIAIISAQDKFGLSIIHIREHSSIIEKFKSLQFMFYAVLSIVIAFIAYYIFVYVWIINKPIKNLYGKILSLNNSQSSNILIKKENIITTGIKKIDIEFNRIISENKKNLKRINEYERTKQLMEIKKLQAEIDPHFLYNVLGHIKFVAMLNDPVQIIKIIDSLFIILKSKKAQVKHIIPVGEEINVLKKYIDLIQLIYGDNIEFEFDIDSIVYGYDMPAFILQPIVENCINHGINPSVKGGKISILGRIANSCVIFEIVDNGIGIQEKAITKIVQYQRDLNGKNEHMGIMNIDKKIKLSCGKDYGISISSEDGKGTRVTVTLSLNPSSNVM